MKAKQYLLLAAVISAPFFASTQEPVAEAKPVSDYIRYRAASEEGKPDVLETAVSRFQKGNHTVDLVSVVHLGDAEYYKRLNENLTGYDAVFYEMVGGPFTKEKAKIAKEARSPNGDLAQVQGLQQMAKNLLGLEFQLDGLDYLSPNFIHADMSADQFSEQVGEGQEMSNMLARALKVAQSGKVRGIPSGEVETNRFMSKMMGAVLAGNSNMLKRSLGPILAEAESFITEIEGDEGSVLIARRNEIVIEKVNESLKTREPGPKKDAILYGAGHMPDLEKRLLGLGYTKADTVWEPSWVITKGAGNRNGNAPDLNQMLKQFGGLMEKMNEE